MTRITLQVPPTAGTTLADEDLSGALGVPSVPAQTGRAHGHLFLTVNRPGELAAPDRVRLAVDRRPGETAFVLARRPDERRWRYCGVGRWIDDEGSWVIPEVDFATWRAFGGGRTASRRFPDEALERARAFVEELLRRRPAGSVIGEGSKRYHLVGPADRGGVRIDGGPGGFSERTVSLTDIAWVLVARDDVATNGGILDEARVNRLRYLEGTPKGSTRWIETGWALRLLRG